MIIDINKQRITSDFVELFAVEYPGGWLYFTTYHTSVYFRDKVSPYTNRQYVPLPVEFTGFEQRSEGAYSRPRLSVANVLTTFSDALGNYTNDDMIGKQIIRRKTLAKYLDNAAGNAHGAPAAPKELPQQVFYIDRIEQENAISISFELASPFDLAGIMIPARNIIPNTCPWPYQGAATDTPFATPVGGCTWKLAANNNGVTAYFDDRNSLFVDSAVHTITASSAAAKNDFFRTSKSLRRVNVDNTISSISGYDYWQAAAAGTTAFRRVRLYSTYSSGSTYYTYLEGNIYNSVVLYNNTVWVCTKSHSTEQLPAIGSRYWKRADKCGKKLSSCAIRYKSQGVTNATGATISVDEDKEKVLYYGAFPASRRYNFTG